MLIKLTAHVANWACGIRRKEIGMGPRRLMALVVLAASAVVTVAAPARSDAPDDWDAQEQAPS